MKDFHGPTPSFCDQERAVEFLMVAGFLVTARDGRCPFAVSSKAISMQKRASLRNAALAPSFLEQTLKWEGCSGANGMYRYAKTFLKRNAES